MDQLQLFLDGIGDIRGDLTRLKNLNINFDQFELVHIDKAALEPLSPVYPKKTKVVELGILFGLALGVGVALVRRLFQSFQATPH